MRRPFASVFRRRIPIDALDELHHASPGIEPTAFVFHASRCGSTLVAQMLAHLPQNIVISEAPPVDWVIGARLGSPAVTDTQRTRWLRAIMSALARPRDGRERHFVVKLDAWNALDVAFVRRAFPRTPWVFVYRDPVDVLVSHATKGRGKHMVPGAVDPRLFGMTADDVPPRVSLDEYAARVLGAIYAAAVAHHERDPGILVHYDELPGAMLHELPSRMGLVVTDADRERMTEVARFDAKTPSMFFERGAASSTPEPLRALATKWVGASYAALERARTSVSAEHR